MAVTANHLKQQVFPRLLGGRLCLDFTNTVEDRAGKHPEDFLTDFSSLVAWGLYTESISEAFATRLVIRARQQTKEAVSVFRFGITLRELIYKVFETLAKGEQPKEDDLLFLSQSYQQLLASARLKPLEQAYYWKLDEAIETELSSTLWLVLHSAITLLTLEDLTRVKRCPGVDGCGWLFFDESKNRSRHWCSMEGCGSRAKMRKQYRRKRKSYAKRR